MKRVRLGFDARYINDQYHGIGRYAFNLIETLSRLASSAHFTIFRGNGSDSRFDWRMLSRRDNVEFLPGPDRLYWPTEQIAWLKLLEREDIHIFHSPYFVAPLLARRSLRVVVTVHDLIFDRYPEYMPQAWARPYYRAMMKNSLRRANRIVAVSKATARDLVQYYPDADGKIAVIREGVQAEFEGNMDRVTAETVRNKYGLEKPFVMTVGVRRPHKNLGRLVRAYALLANDIEHHLVLVGPGDPRFSDEAAGEVERLKLSDRVHFLDWVPETDMPALYRVADLVVLPSMIEGFGLPALEAIAGGTVVAAAENSAYSEVLGEAGIFFDPQRETALAEAIRTGLTNCQLRQRLTERGYSRLHNYAWEDVALKTLTLYDAILT